MHISDKVLDVSSCRNELSLVCQHSVYLKIQYLFNQPSFISNSLGALAQSLGAPILGHPSCPFQLQFHLLVNYNMGENSFLVLPHLS